MTIKKTTNKTKTIKNAPTSKSATKTLAERTQEVRDNVKAKLQMEMINRRISKISNQLLANTKTEKMIEKLELNKKVTEYELTTLDKKHPLYETRKEEAERNAENVIKRINEDIDYNKNYLKNSKELIEKLENEIEKIENGEIKITLEKLNLETETAISRM